MKWIGPLMAVTACVFTSMAMAGDNSLAPGSKIIGDNDLPKALYIVPWKKPVLAPPPARSPAMPFFDDALSTIDRDIFIQQMQYRELLYEKRKK